MDKLKKCPHIIEVKKLYFKKEIDMFPNRVQQYASEVMRKVSVYRIVYKVGKLRIMGFVTLPKQGKHLPCLIHLRGGSKDFGAIDAKQILFGMAKYAKEGYVVIATQYPGVDGGGGKDTWGGKDDVTSIKKLREILKWIPQADTSRIGVKGHSRGGFMAYLMLAKVTWIKAAVIGAAPTDQFKQADEREGWREHQIKIWGKSKSELKKRSPIKWVDQITKKAPILIMHGSADWRVEANHSINMSAELYKHKIPHRLILFEGADHAISEFKREYTTQTINWFDRFLKKSESLPNMEFHGA